jgi:hypothetical protein
MNYKRIVQIEPVYKTPLNRSIKTDRLHKTTTTTTTNSSLHRTASRTSFTMITVTKCITAIALGYTHWQIAQQLLVDRHIQVQRLLSEYQNKTGLQNTDKGLQNISKLLQI